MAEQKVDVLIEGGKATAAPPLGPALGPLGVNIGEVVAEINKKTIAFKGMQVPVTVTVNTENRQFTITIGTPPASSLIKKEAGIEKGSANPKSEKIADLKIENIIKIAKMKEDSLFGKDLKAKIKEIIGTCCSMGIMIEGKNATDALADIDNGLFDKEIKQEKTDISQQEQKELEEERKKMESELKEKRKEFEKKANEVLSKLEGKTRNEKKHKLIEAGIPAQLINELLPQEEKKK